MLAVKVDGEVRLASCEFEYMDKVKHGFTVTGPVYPASARGSTVTVQSLRVTEL